MATGIACSTFSSGVLEGVAFLPPVIRNRTIQSLARGDQLFLQLVATVSGGRFSCDSHWNCRQLEPVDCTGSPPVTRATCGGEPVFRQAAAASGARPV